MDAEYTYCVAWSAEDEEFVGTCIEFPSLSYLKASPDGAFFGIRTLVFSCISDMRCNNEPIPAPMNRP